MSDSYKSCSIGSGANGCAPCTAIKKSAPQYPVPIRTNKRGIDLLHDPFWNKSLGFEAEERNRLGIRGLLPPAVRTLRDQVERTVEQIRTLPDAMVKSLFLQELHNRNETLYHRILIDYIEEMAPLVYTPIVGDVCKNFGHRFSRSRGMFFSSRDRGSFSTMVYNWPIDDVQIIVVTDGSRILGLGDLGAHGMGIPIGKLALYVAAGGIAPHRVLPIVLDVGTNNEELLKDPNYIGLQHRRLEGQEYFDYIEEFMQAVYHRWPQVVVQFEDFETSKAVPILNKYRYDYRCFNDDIQGTGCVTLAGLLAASRAAGSRLRDARFLCAGAGSAGLGVCGQIVDGMVEEGLTREEALKSFVVFSSLGALGAPDEKYGNPNFQRGISEDRKPWINPAVSDGASMMEVMKTFKPTCLLGLSTVSGIFDEVLIRQMASQCDKPIILPMSNPTSKAECTAEQAYEWTDGRAMVASGSPFPPYQMPDGSRTLYPSQCNNMYVFPGIGLAASVAGIKRITNRMFYLAAVACAYSLSETDKAEGRTFPKIQTIREVSLNVACAIIDEALNNDLCTSINQELLQRVGLRAYVCQSMYDPEYAPLLAAL